MKSRGIYALFALENIDTPLNESRFKLKKSKNLEKKGGPGK